MTSPTVVFRSKLKQATPVVFLSLLYSTCSPIALGQEISSSTTTPVETSTINGGAASDITITEDGSINLADTDGVVAVTVNSSNNVTVDGDINIDDSDNATGIKIGPDYSSNISISGTVNVLEDYTRTDIDDDDDLDGDIASGTNRNGIFLESGGTHTGDITLESGSSIAIEGNNSSGITLGSKLQGNYTQDGTISLYGANSTGLDIQDDVSGDVLISGIVTVNGENANAVKTHGDIGGALTIESSVVSTGFLSTTNTNYIGPDSVDDDTLDVEDRLDAEALYNNGSALVIGGSVANGVLINGYHNYVNDGVDSADDETKDTIDDFNENRTVGYIATYGSAPAVRIAPDADNATTDLVLGSVIETVRDTLDDDEDEDTTEVLTTFNFDQGFVNLGSIYADGQNVGFSATGLQIAGSADGLYETIITNGIFNSGSISTYSFGADAIAIDLLKGANIGSLFNESTITASTTGASGNQATAINIAEGANLSSIENTGSISAIAIDDDGTSIAIKDTSGTLSTIINKGQISSYYSDDDTLDDEYDDNGDKISEFTGRSIAIDVSSHTSAQGLTIEQGVDGDNSTPYIVGDILFGAGNDVLDIKSGRIVGDTYFGDGSADFSLSQATYTGDLHFESADFNFNASEGTFLGDINFYGHSGAITFENDSYFSGNFVNSSNIDVTFNDSSLYFSQASPITIRSLNATGQSVLGIVITGNEVQTGSYITTTENSVLGDGVVLDAEFSDFISESFSRAILTSPNISVDAATLDFDRSELSWLYNADFSLTENADNTETLALNFALKTSNELGLDAQQDAAYAAVLELLADDDAIGSEFVQVTDEAIFLDTYESFLPQHSDVALRHLDAQTSTINSMISDRLALLRLSSHISNGFWLQETFSYTTVDSDDVTNGYEGRGFGFTAGVDRRLGLIDSVGATFSITDEKYENATTAYNQTNSTNYALGVYAAEQMGFVDLQLAAQVGQVNYQSTRNIAFQDFDSEVEGDWSGFSQAYSALLSTQKQIGWLVLRPQVGINYVSLTQDAYDETATNGFNFSYSESTADKLTATAGLSLGVHWPTNGRRSDQSFNADPTAVSQGTGWYSALDLGIKNTLSSTRYASQANFVGYDTTFNILSQETFDDAITTGLSMTGVGEYATFRLSAGAELSDGASTFTGAASLRFKF